MLQYTTPAKRNSVSLTREWFIIYSTVPLAASAFSSPSRQIMAIPVMIKPIWLREEQAKIYLRLLLNTAITAPSTAAIATGSSGASSMLSRYTG